MNNKIEYIENYKKVKFKCKEFNKDRKNGECNRIECTLFSSIIVGNCSPSIDDKYRYITLEWLDYIKYKGLILKNE